MTTAEAIAERLKDFGHNQPNSDWSEMDSDTERLIRGNPFALLLAVAFDRGMPWQKAWQIPAEIHQKGFLDPKLLASRSEAELVELLNSLPFLPRYGAQQGARTLSEAARLVCERFDGDADAIWKNAVPAEVEKTLQEIHGIGPGIASMTTRILYEDFDCFRGQQRQIDVKPDSLLLRVFRRAGLIDKESEDQARRAARRLNPEFPAALDWPAWRIAQRWCHPKEPDCAPCPLTTVCAKRI